MTGTYFLQRLSNLARRMHIPHWVFNYSSSFLMQLPKINLDESLQSVYTMRVVNKQDLNLLAYCREMENPEEGVVLFTNRLLAGAHCHALFDSENNVLGYVWVMLSKNLLEDHDRYQVYLTDSQAYIFDTYLHRRARGKNLYGFMLAQAQEILRKKDISELFVIVDETNIVSLKAHTKLGAFKLEKTTYSCFLGITLHTVQFVNQKKKTLALIGDNHPVESFALPKKISYEIVIQPMNTVEDWNLKAESIYAYEQLIPTLSPFKQFDIIKKWWEIEIKSKNPVFILEIYQISVNGLKNLLAYEFFRLEKDSKRFLKPMQLVAFDDLYFMSNTFFIRHEYISSQMINEILGMKLTQQKIHEATGADMIIWHRLAKEDLFSQANKKLPYCSVKQESTYPILEIDDSNSFFTSPNYAHALRDIVKQKNRLNNAYKAFPEVICKNVESLGFSEQDQLIDRFLVLLRKTWQYKWMSDSDKVDIDIYERKVIEYTRIWVKSGILKLYFLTLRNEDIALLYTLQSSQYCWCIMTGYNPDFKSYSPGKMLFLEMLNESNAHGVNIYHLGGNIVGWKEEWTTNLASLYCAEFLLHTPKAILHLIKRIIRRENSR
jgi:hypothetical protein